MNFLSLLCSSQSPTTSTLYQSTQQHKLETLSQYRHPVAANQEIIRVIEVLRFSLAYSHPFDIPHIPLDLDRDQLPNQFYTSRTLASTLCRLQAMHYARGKGKKLGRVL